MYLLTEPVKEAAADSVPLSEISAAKTAALGEEKLVSQYNCRIRND